VLERILRSTRVELERRKRELPQVALQQRIEQRAGGTPVGTSPRKFRAAIMKPGVAVIAEFKRRSPSAGVLREQADLGELVRAYERGGASALSVLTEEANFGGSLEDLRAAQELCDLPTIRKDFIVDDYQLLEARAAGADAVLLIVAALGDEELQTLHRSACALDLDVLVEIHDGGELARALAIEPDLIGINNRDLRDFSVDVGRTKLLREGIPAEIGVVSESGIHSAEQLRELERDGVDAVLVGESLMRASDPRRALLSLLGRDETLAQESETAGLPTEP
jgi:indole-3-glycerol phosphate synthase